MRCARRMDKAVKGYTLLTGFCSGQAPRSRSNSVTDGFGMAVLQVGEQTVPEQIPEMLLGHGCGKLSSLMICGLARCTMPVCHGGPIGAVRSNRENARISVTIRRQANWVLTYTSSACPWPILTWP